MLLQKEDTLNLTNIHSLGVCAKKLYDSRLTHFAYKISHIVDEVKSRTNYIGANRSTKEGRTLVDNITYTNDEFDLDRHLTKDAMANVFMPLCEFAEGLAESYLYDEETNTHHVEPNHGYTFDYAYTIYNSSPNVKVELTSDKLLTTDHYALVTLDIAYDVTDIFGSKTRKSIKHEHLFKYTDTYEVVGEGNNVKYVYSATITPEYEADTVDNGLGAETVTVVSVSNIIGRAQEYRPVTIKKGEWIELHIGDTVELYVCHTQCTSNNKMGCPNYYTFMPFDFRKSIHYILWFPELNNNGVLDALDVHIENALITYIMYRWFLKVYPDEANRWYAEFERRMALIEELLDRLRGAYGERPLQYI